MVRERDQLAPVKLENLDSAERPTETLLLQTIEVQRHQPLAVGRRVVDALVAGAEDAQGGFRTLGDAFLIPATDLIERRTPNQPHGPAEDDGVAVTPRRHRDVEEIAKAVEETAEVLVVSPVTVVLRRLHECDRRIFEVADRVLQPLRMHAIVRVDDPENLDLFGKVLGGFVESAGLEPWPVLEMDEREPGAEFLAELFERSPYGLVGGVVVDDLNDEIWIAHLSQGLERGADHLHRLVVRRHLQRHPRQSNQRGDDTRHSPAREHVADLEAEGD